MKTAKQAMEEFIQNGKNLDEIPSDMKKYLRQEPSNKKGLFEIVKQDDVKKQLFCKFHYNSTEKDLIEWLSIYGNVFFKDYDVYIVL